MGQLKIMIELLKIMMKDLQKAVEKAAAKAAKMAKEMAAMKNAGEWTASKNIAAEAAFKAIVEA